MPLNASRRAGLLLALSLVLVGCSGDDAAEVAVVPASVGRVEEVVDAPGTVTAKATATVTSPASGTVSAVLVEDGETVRKGQLLARISSPEAKDRLRQAESALANARSGRVSLPRTGSGLRPLQAQLDAAASSSLAAGRAAAEQIPDPEARKVALKGVTDAARRYREASAAARSSLAQLDSGAGSLESAVNAVGNGQRAQAAAAVTAARRTVDALTIRAPISGVVTLGAGASPAGGGSAGLLDQVPEGLRGQAEAALGGSSGGASTSSPGLPVGSPVSSGAPLLTVTDLSGLGVDAEVDETDVLSVRRGQQATVTVDAVPDTTYDAVVTAVDVMPTTSARGGVGYRVHLDLGAGTRTDGSPAPTPRPGMSAVVDLLVRKSEGVVTVPTAAVLREDGKNVVYVVADGRAQRREVVLGAQGESTVEVTQGLTAGDQVVARDVDRLRDGQPVER